MDGKGNTNKYSPLTAWKLGVRTWEQIREHEMLTRASAIAFSGLSAFVPFLALVLTISAHMLPDLSTTDGTGIGSLTVEQFQATLKALFPPAAHDAIQEVIMRLQNRPPFAFVSISLAVALWGSSSLFVGIIDALNRIYGVKQQRSFLRVRLLAMGMSLGLALIMLIACATIVIWPQVVTAIGWEEHTATLATAVKWLVVFLMLLVSFAFVFRLGPEPMQRQKFLTAGGIFGTVALIATSLGLRTYVQNFAHYDQLYGSFGGIMTLFLWFYVSSLVMLAAAELNSVINYAANYKGEPLPPSERPLKFKRLV